MLLRQQLWPVTTPVALRCAARCAPDLRPSRLWQGGQARAGLRLPGPLLGSAQVRGSRALPTACRTPAGAACDARRARAAFAGTPSFEPDRPRPARSSPRCSSARRPCTRTTGRCTPMTASAWGPGRAPTSPRAVWCSSCPTRRPGGSSAPWVRSPWRCRTRVSAPGVLRPALRLGLGALRTDRLTALPAFCASPYARLSLNAY